MLQYSLSSSPWTHLSYRNILNDGGPPSISGSRARGRRSVISSSVFSFLSPSIWLFHRITRTLMVVDQQQFDWTHDQVVQDKETLCCCSITSLSARLGSRSPDQYTEVGARSTVKQQGRMNMLKRSRWAWEILFLQMFTPHSNVTIPVYISSSKQNRLWAFTQHSCALGRSFLSELDAPLSSSVDRFSSWIISQPAGFSLLPRCQWFAARPLAGEVRGGHSSLCKTCLSDREEDREGEEDEEDERDFEMCWHLIWLSS